MVTEDLWIGNRVFKAEKLTLLIGSKAKPHIPSNKSGVKKSGEYAFVDESREGIPLVGFYRIA